MKKTGLFILIVCASVLMGTSGFTEEMDKAVGDSQDRKGMMSGKKMGMMGKKGMMMGPMMMKGMEKSMIATPDGGVIVLAGNHLVKYDKNLNVVKEADIKVDMAAMQKEMEGMMKMCSMMQDGMKGMGEESAEAGGGPAEAQADSSDHSAHH